MPRKAPKEVIEHRITLGDYERKMIAKQLSEDDLIKKVQTGAKIGQTVLIGAGGIALGTLAVTAYREAHDLVDSVADVPSGLWNMTKFRLGLMSLDDLIATTAGDVEENEQASQDRKNRGVLEWGFEWMMKFLLGDDMIFTKATETNGDSTTDQNGHDVADDWPDSPAPDLREANMYDRDDPYYKNAEGWYWNYQTEAWTFGAAPPKPKPSEGASYWEEMERTFCDITSPHYDEEICRDVQFDKVNAGY